MMPVAPKASSNVGGLLVTRDQKIGAFDEEMSEAGIKRAENNSSGWGKSTTGVTARS